VRNSRLKIGMHPLRQQDDEGFAVEEAIARPVEPGAKKRTRVAEKNSYMIAR
jgi:hypothetical protein